MTDQIKSFSSLLRVMQVMARATPDRATAKIRINAVSLFLVCKSTLREGLLAIQDNHTLDAPNRNVPMLDTQLVTDLLCLQT